MTLAGRAMKRLIDVVVSATALALGWPSLVALALWIRRDSPGPAVFRQERAGRNMKPFMMLKFRTMRTDAEPFGSSPASAQDARLTGLGPWLRESSLDELPQLWNILKGDMSLVGPRPLYVSQAEAFTPRQRRRLEVRPGLTGLAQIQGRGEVPHEDKLEIDVQYVERMSLWLDAKILWQTLRKGFGRQTAYQKW
ncbi:MAG TPA: sugar transferase [Phycisphaerae bacterium]|nr:sugar transferase [Phycisphaerae bacterium]